MRWRDDVDDVEVLENFQWGGECCRGDAGCGFDMRRTRASRTSMMTWFFLTCSSSRSYAFFMCPGYQLTRSRPTISLSVLGFSPGAAPAASPAAKWTRRRCRTASAPLGMHALALCMVRSRPAAVSICVKSRPMHKHTNETLDPNPRCVAFKPPHVRFRSIPVSTSPNLLRQILMSQGER